jgi:hypothetical protein
MRAEGVRGIVAVSSSDAALDRHQRRAEQVEVWQGTVPDRKQLLVHCARTLGVASIPALCEALGYTGAPEDLGMWLCFFAGDALAQNCLGHPRARALACASQQDGLQARVSQSLITCAAVPT